MMTVNCKFCDGMRPVDAETQRCRGCAMEQHECSKRTEPAGKRSCPICDNRMVVWCENFTRLKCIGCRNVFEPILKGDLQDGVRGIAPVAGPGLACTG